MFLGVVSAAAPRLRRLTPLTSLLLLASAAAWLGVVVVARHMGSMPGTMGLGIGSFAAVWALMMTAMMLPVVIPFASLYTRRLTDHRGPRLVAFGSGYLLVWSLAAIPAFALAWLVDRFEGGHPSVATGLAVAIFAGCGFYQLTPIKDRCLARCRSPLGFVIKFGAYKGPTRDVRAGLYHGGFCLACCWGLMALLVAFGLMNLTFMVGLSAVILGEKSLTWGSQFSRGLGVIALALAVVVVFIPGVAPGLHPNPSPQPDMGRM